MVGGKLQFSERDDCQEPRSTVGVYFLPESASMQGRRWIDRRRLGKVIINPKCAGLFEPSGNFVGHTRRCPVGDVYHQLVKL